MGIICVCRVPPSHSSSRASLPTAHSLQRDARLSATSLPPDDQAASCLELQELLTRKVPCVRDLPACSAPFSRVISIIVLVPRHCPPFTVCALARRACVWQMALACGTSACRRQRIKDERVSPPCNERMLPCNYNDIDASSIDTSCTSFLVLYLPRALSCDFLYFNAQIFTSTSRCGHETTTSAGVSRAQPALSCRQWYTRLPMEVQGHVRW